MVSAIGPWLRVPLGPWLRVPPCLVLALCLSASCRALPEEERVAEAVRRAAQEDAPPDAARGVAGAEEAWAAVRAFSLERDGRPAWTDRSGLSGAGKAVARALCRAPEEGLEPARYGVAAILEAWEAARQGGPDSVAAERLARLELLVGMGLGRYGSDAATGRVAAERIAEVHLPVRELRPRALLASVAAAENPEDVLRSVPPHQEGYRALREALARYRRIAAEGGWREVPVLSGEADGRGREALRARLIASGDLPADAGGTLGEANAALEEAVRRFQARHGLDVDGVPGPNTREALNVPVERRIQQIERNMERWRFLPERLGERYVLVNVPAFRLEAHGPAGKTLEMAVVVGSEYEDRATPVFADTMRTVEFAPFWHVPVGIALRETLPAAESDPGYLERHGYEIVPAGGPGREGREPDGETEDNGGFLATDGRRVGPEAIASGAYALRQRPGPRNALGRVKFLFPNQHAIYVHDTPERELFRRARRTFSHGCIRVARPEDLAAFVLAASGWTREAVKGAMEAGRTRRVALTEPLPVYILYLTAFVEEDGRVNVREDVYGYDRNLARALAASDPPEERRVAARRACETLLGRL